MRGTTLSYRGTSGVIGRGAGETLFSWNRMGREAQPGLLSSGLPGGALDMVRGESSASPIFLATGPCRSSVGEGARGRHPEDAVRGDRRSCALSVWKRTVCLP